MKRYTLKLAIAFIIIYAILMVVVVFAYTRISETFIINEAQNNLVESGNTLTQRINAQLDFDYEKLNDMINSYIELSLDPVVELNSRIDEIMIQDQTYLGFGILDSRDLVIGGNRYTYIFDFDDTDIRQSIGIYSFSQAFSDVDETPYVFFNIGEYMAYFDAEAYFDGLLELSTLKSDYFIMSENNTIFYQTLENSSASYLFNLLRDDGMTDNSIDLLIASISLGENVVIQVPFLGVSSFITFNPLNRDFSIEHYYLVIVYHEEDIINSLSYLTNILWALFFVIFILFALAMLVLYKILEQKVNDIENARLAHYYSKPYIIRITHKGKIKSYNRSFKKLLGDYDVYDKVSDFKIKKEDNPEVIESIIHQQKAFTVLFEIGVDKMVYVHFVPVRTSGGYLLIGHDTSNVEGKFDEYRNLALFDKVTGLPNQNSLKQDLQDLFADKDAISMKNSIVAFDIVDFSKINLLLGEKSGERFLIIFSELAKQSLEGYPSNLYNFDNDVFVVLFKDIENYNWVNRWITRLLSIFEKPITLDKNFIEVDAKVGIFNIETERYEILNADVAFDNMMLALNHAKESSAHKSFLYDVSLSMVASREQRMEIDLANGIKNQEFLMALQPQYNNALERITGFEALIRWSNPKYAGESPLKFIQMAEKNYMIIDIGRIALHETFMIAKEMEPYDVHISINISPVQILQAGFVNEVISIFEQYDLKKHSISLEITETFLIGSFELVINKLKLLQKYGFDIHLDDFGTGYSSLQYLRDLPISTIKIDRAFIINLETDAHSRAIVSMISSLAKNIGLEVISEGIENEKQNQIVVKSGCDIIQGYLIGPAVYKNEAIKLIQAYNVDKTKKVNVQRPVKTKGV
ncbi:MAG: bifunctional diguanylate cyclase/phosphodiesterase [Firmicutes bacterium]|nr:bifunctional diguanylate cyclase/phosphodiesterase [Bacillota bacterium]